VKAARGGLIKEVLMADPAPFRQPDAGVEPHFEFERFDVYRVALEFQSLVPRLVGRRGLAALRDQLCRASASILLNTAEGCGRTSRGEKASFYAIARGSAMECAAALDILLTRGVISFALHRQARGLLIRVTQMLTKLILRMQP
jgi:four helix bundle protein